MRPDESWQLIEERRLAIADMLDLFTPQEWERESLCASWRVRDVAAHLVLGASAAPLRAILREAVRSRGNFDRLNQDLAVRYAQRPTGVIAAELRSIAGSRDLPVVTNYRNIMFDVLVHGEDIAVPLHKTLPFPTAAGPMAAETVWRLRWPWSTQRRFRGLSFSATDTDWSAGVGPSVRGPIRSLLLALTGRPAALPELSGDGLPDLMVRIGPLPQPAHPS